MWKFSPLHGINCYIDFLEYQKYQIQWCCQGGACGFICTQFIHLQVHPSLKPKLPLSAYVHTGAHEPPEGQRRSVRLSIRCVRRSSSALLHLWPAAGYFHWLSSIVIAPPILHSLQPHYRLSQLASTVWLVQK